MLVNSVSLVNQSSNPAFKASLEEQMFSKLNDGDIRRIAWAKASQDVNDKKHRKIDNTLFYSLPIAGGISAAVREISPEAIAKYGKKNVRAIRLARFGVVTAAWTAGLAALGALWGAKDYLAKKVDIIKNNPVMSSVVTFVAGFGVLAGVNKFGAKGLNKLLSSVDEKKIVPVFNKVRNALNNSKILNKIAEFGTKTPSPIKDIARNAAELAPLLVIGTQIGHLFGHQRARAQVAVNNYQDLKQAQSIIRDNISDDNIDSKINQKQTISDLHAQYEQMLKTKPIMDASTKEPITFEQYVKLATTMVK